MSKRRKILVSAYACNPASSAQLHPGEDIIGWELVNQLCRFHDVWVITHRYNKAGFPKDGTAGLPISQARFHFIALPRPFWNLYRFDIGERLYYYFWQILAWRVARRLHERIGFDIAHHITFNNDWIPSFIGAFLPVPFVWGPVGGGQKTPPGFLGVYSLKDRVADYIRDFGQIIGREILLTRQRCLKKARVILVCNKETKRRMPSKYALKIQFFPVNGIQESDLAGADDRDRLDGQPRDFRILTTGRLVHWKYFEAAIRSFAIFSRNHPEARLSLIGDGSQKNALMMLARDLEIRDRVQFTAWMKRADLLETMRRSDVFLYPSLREGGGAVVVEAMASGLPVICLDLAGPSLHIQETCGLKIEPRDPDSAVREMAAALERLSRDGEWRRSLGRAARARARDVYLWDRLGERLQRIYESLEPLGPG